MNIYSRNKSSYGHQSEKGNHTITETKGLVNSQEFTLQSGCWGYVVCVKGLQACNEIATNQYVKNV